MIYQKEFCCFFITLLVKVMVRFVANSQSDLFGFKSCISELNLRTDIFCVIFSTFCFLPYLCRPI